MRFVPFLACCFVTFSFVARVVGAAPATAPVSASSRVSAVTVYQGSALVTREVQVPEGVGMLELIVTPLPPQTIDSSLYSESADGIRILTTRYRTRAVKEDTRAEVRAKEDQIRALRAEAERIAREIQVIDQNLALLIKLENFTAATMQQLAEKGLLNGETTVALTKYVMDQRQEKSLAQVALQQQARANADATQFAQRELAELTAGATRTERDAVIVVDKANAAAGVVRLNYLVAAATWRPQYKLRAAGEKDAVQVEYLAAIVQQSGEDWSDVSVSLSTAQPMLSAAPPELSALDVSVTAAAATGAGGGPDVAQLKVARAEVDRLRREAQVQANRSDYLTANARINEAAAMGQTAEMLGEQMDVAREGPAVTYHLKTRFTVPSRSDEQLLEVARLPMSPSFFYKAVPVITPHVYRQATLTNASDYVLLPGSATMYLGTDFVGRMDLPLVAIGETFTAGFGVDPQLQVAREMLDKNRSVQGGNQVHDFRYRIRISSFKKDAVQVQVWDRLPRAEEEAVGVTLVRTEPVLSADPHYLRHERPTNLLRWDLTVDPGANGETAKVIEYEFKLEYDKNLALGGFKAGK
jgi:uncharacterized protein (TIGR02231 family)